MTAEAAGPGIPGSSGVPQSRKRCQGLGRGLPALVNDRFVQEKPRLHRKVLYESDANLQATLAGLLGREALPLGERHHWLSRAIERLLVLDHWEKWVQVDEPKSTPQFLDDVELEPVARAMLARARGSAFWSTADHLEPITAIVRAAILYAANSEPRAQE